METPAGPAPAAVRAAASRPGVRAAFDRAHRALGDLRFAEGLRRGWEEARAEAAVSIAAPAQLLGVLRGFAKHLGMPARARAAFIRQVERDVGIQVARLDVSGYQLEIPGLVVHAADDQLVAASEAQLIHKAWFDSRLLLLEGGGHQRVLADPRLSQAVLELLASSSAPARQSA